jgi:hypothetical protein
MCLCTPAIRDPWCGVGACVRPAPERRPVDVIAADVVAAMSSLTRIREQRELAVRVVADEDGRLATARLTVDRLQDELQRALSDAAKDTVSC